MAYLLFYCILSRTSKMCSHCHKHYFISCLQLGFKFKICVFRWFKFTLKPPYSIAHDKLQLVIWDTSFWTFLLKFGHKGP